MAGVATIVDGVGDGDGTEGVVAGTREVEEVEVSPVVVSFFLKEGRGFTSEISLFQEQ